MVMSLVPNFFIFVQYHSRYAYILHTVTKATQNEAFPWKRAVIEMEKGPRCTSPILVFTIPPCGKSQEPDLLQC